MPSAVPRMMGWKQKDQVTDFYFCFWLVFEKIRNLSIHHNYHITYHYHTSTHHITSHINTSYHISKHHITSHINTSYHIMLSTHRIPSRVNASYHNTYHITPQISLHHVAVQRQMQPTPRLPCAKNVTWREQMSRRKCPKMATVGVSMSRLGRPCVTPASRIDRVNSIADVSNVGSFYTNNVEKSTFEGTVSVAFKSYIQMDAEMNIQWDIQDIEGDLEKDIDIDIQWDIRGN